MFNHDLQNLRKWTNNPVIVTFAERSKPVSEIPFPAVTICPVDKLSAESINFTDVYHQYKRNESHLLSQSERHNFEAATQICTWSVESSEEVKSEMLNSSDFDTSETVKLLDDMSVSLNETILYGSFRNKVLSEKRFKKIITEEGICFTFNMLDLSELLHQNE